MSALELCRQSFLEFKQSKQSKKNKPIINECQHVKILLDNGIGICTDCGEEVQKNIHQAKQWKCDGDTTQQQQIERDSIRNKKSNKRGISSLITPMNFSEEINQTAEEIYQNIKGDKIFRGRTRQVIAYACVYLSFKKHNNPQAEEDLIKLFNIDKASSLSGLKIVNEELPKNMRTRHVTPDVLITQYLDKFNATPDQHETVRSLYQKIRNKSSKINSAQPQSVAAGLIYYWICKTEKNISIDEFVKHVGLGKLTINKMYKEITRIINKSSP